MQTIGERLEDARKGKGLSIREAAEATKIRGDYLQKFEANTFDLDLPPLYVRGFLRAYARFLELDTERFIAEFDSQIASEGHAPRRESREVYGRVEFGASSDEAAKAAANGGQINHALLIKYGVIGGGALVLLIIILVLVNVFTSHPPAKPVSPPQTQAQNTTPPTTQPPDSAQTLTFTATETTRIKVVQDADKRLLFDGALTRGETKSFRKTGKLLITVEKGSNLRMEVNGRSYTMPIDGYGRFALD